MKQQDHGFVLVNALILIAALASVATLLLARADAGRERLSQSRAAYQLELNLDAFEALAIHTLVRTADGGPDHLQRDWAKARYDVPLEHGRVAGHIKDLQGLFNINWLTDQDNTDAHTAFDRLVLRLGVSAQDNEAIHALLRPGGPEDTAAYLSLDPPETPVGGALFMIQQLDRMPGISARGRDRLRPYLTALPGDSKLNINTADPLVLAAFLPSLSAAEVDQLLASRRQSPFTSVQDLLVLIGMASEAEDDPDAAPESISTLASRLDIRSEWFKAQITASVGSRKADRQSVLHRTGIPAKAVIAWRLTSRY